MTNDDKLIKAMEDGYKITYNEPLEYLTDEVNNEYKWTIERTKRPFCDKYGYRIWSGSNVFEALEKAEVSFKKTI